MILRAAILSLSALLCGCIIFDQKSEAVVFHQFAAPGAQPSRTVSAGPQLFIPRASIPSALRRPNVVLVDDGGWVRIEDAHRWVAPLDRAIPEAVGRHLSALTGVVTTTQTPSEDHLVLLLTVDKMEIFAPAGPERSIFSLPGGTDKADNATLQLTCRLEKADGTPISVKTLAQSRPLKDRTPAAFVRAQSANLAVLSAEIAKWLPTTAPSSK
ncbi:MAG: PqiC family protein [Opitutales bacterium]|jgi:ABC-type uncharacterized transport system auxiliary subunit|nr:PqiC family protein [Opitutales bacterium]MDP4659244.1 PqiC family protein [Opitutales bacterium]MDP4774867.1 PqiC family protein [Opitutales bacterium]MDP4787165.1 PqiC family protein [Opitutales bacterium]MDP4860720.1 PqiC family protein [Opitutales bacterium]